MTSRASKRNRHSAEDPCYDETRRKIDATRIINRLVNHTLGKNKMSSTQITAGLGLLKKVLPDLSNVEVKASVTTEQPWIGPKPKTAEEWEEEHGETLQ